ncbi:HIT family protein [Crocinitomix catalasitica]|nr:HIT family protein [Crocinitomix catalasitica]
MPSRISREVALQRLCHERPDPNQCLVCERIMNTDTNLVLTKSDHLIAFLSRYPRFWGHTIIAPKEHFTQFHELPTNVYAACFDLAREIAIKQEKYLNPANVYIASIGSDQDLLNSCSHFHIHVLPIYDEGIKPSEVFSWKDGIFEAEEDEWIELTGQLNW